MAASTVMRNSTDCVRLRARNAPRVGWGNRAITANRIKPVIDKVFGFDDVHAAHEHIAAGAQSMQAGSCPQ